MIDGIKAILKDNLDAIRSNPNLDFLVPSSIITGEVKENKFLIAEHKGLTFIDKKMGEIDLSKSTKNLK